ncbi:hypothetical protein AB1K62_14330 [Parasphingorhabdus sp. JC815]|uniref:hypothetical protein n=1 Tax=Parasphingorhabdus sp. JC815 TaxID=3232140 RepID=UPI00345A1959
MIELPDFARIGSATPMFVDAGFTQRGIGSLSRIDRKGSRYKMACSYGPFYPENGRVMVSKLIAGKSEGVRIPFPLLVSQGSPGSPLVSGSHITGKTLNIKGLTPGYVCKDGFWLSLVKSGRHFLHNVKTGGTASGSGTLSVVLNEMLRDSFVNNSVVHLAEPMVEGLVDGSEWQWSLSVDRVTPIQFTIEEVR